MRSVSSNVATLLRMDHVSFFYLFDLGPYFSRDGNGGTTWFTDHFTTVPGGCTIGGATYLSDGNLLHVDPPKQSNVVDREAYKVTIADVDFWYRSCMESGFSSVPMRLRVGFYNVTGAPLGGWSVGMPMLNESDLITVYKGVTDTAAYNIEPDGSVALTVECSSPMGSLQMVRSIITGQDYLKQIDATDTAYDQIFAGSKGVDIIWGKKK